MLLTQLLFSVFVWFIGNFFVGQSLLIVLNLQKPLPSKTTTKTNLSVSAAHMAYARNTKAEG
jgi:hypothetical protein